MTPDGEMRAALAPKSALPGEPPKEQADAARDGRDDDRQEPAAPHAT